MAPENYVGLICTRSNGANVNEDALPVMPLKEKNQKYSIAQFCLDLDIHNVQGALVSSEIMGKSGHRDKTVFLVIV